ncbi:CBS domain-containing protein [Micromonospora saelicesensis]|uniref:CBS domain-containing protein n=1 Tax=Micromonospora saelicesensis TaxID=285676 RepID=UPI000DDBD0E6|nr:CBS domain-containing protein [Micromonospora saelicesensis]
MVRAGRVGEREADALAESVVIAGWPEVGDLTNVVTRRELHAVVRAAYPNRSRTVVANWTGQLWRLVRVMDVDDFVVIPLKTVPDHVAIGRISASYRYRRDAAPDRRHVRPVEWIRRALPRSSIEQDLLYSLGSLLTICQLRRNGAARRIAALAATGIDPGPNSDELSSNEWVTPDDFIAQAAAADDGVELTIRELLAHWGAGRRTSSAVAVIQRDLGESSLSAVPPFTEGWIGSRIRVVKSGAEADDSIDETATEKLIEEEESPGSEEAESEDDDLLPEKPFTLRFGNLLRSDVAVVAVKPNDSVVRARSRMLGRNFSQLAIIDEDGTFHGAVSWESIAKAQMTYQAVPTVMQAKQAAPLAAYDDLVLPRIDDISGEGFIFVRSRDGKAIAGIVTAADLTTRFGEIARPFTMIEECERRLNRRVKAKISDEEIKAATNNRHRSAETLTFGSYGHALREEKHFLMLDWDLDHGEFLEHVVEVAKIRNRMMHFSPDPIPPEWGAIDGLLAMLRAVDPLS